MDGTLSTSQGGKNPLEDQLNDQRGIDEYIDYSELISDTVFIGPYPFDEIISSILDQFNDYINMEDRTDYVDIFYDQMGESLEVLKSDDEEHPVEKMEALDKINNQFVSIISNLFRLRLAMTIWDDSESAYGEELEYRIRKLYEFFILNGRKNLKTAITKDVNSRMGKSSMMLDDKEYLRTIDNLLDGYYTPLITGMTPMQYIEYLDDEDILDMYDDGSVCGNFLRKYSPKLYQNDEFRCELISFITLTQQMGKELLSNGK